MDPEKVRNYCLKHEAADESFPFGENTLVFKVMGKMFCLMSMTPPWSINLKCDPEKAIELRERNASVRPGYHMNKQHWNTIDLDGSIKEKVIEGWISDSYNLVVNSLPKKERVKLRGIE